MHRARATAGFRQITGMGLAAVLALLSGAAGAQEAVNWPQFRGPGARGVAENPGLPERWSSTRNVEWKTDIPGRGWSSPIVCDDRVFLTTVVNQGESEEPKKGLYFGGNRPDPPDTLHQWRVYCLDLATGEVLWERQVHEGKPAAPIHIKNSYASETPATDGERVYVYFGGVGIWCFDLDGAVVWEKEMPARRMRYGWGTAASPVLHEDRLYVVDDNQDESVLLALDKRTGEEILRVPRDEKSNWSTPFVWENAQRTEIVTLGSGKVRSYSLEGELLWTLKGMSSITIATPYAYDGLLYFSSGYVGNRERPLYAVRPGAEGDISLAEGDTSNTWVAWSQPKGAPYNPTTLAYKGRIYVLYDGGMMACFDAKDGTEVFKRTRIPDARRFTTSPWAYNGKIFCLNEDGVTFVLEAADELKPLHTNTLADDDMCMATPAIAGDRLLIRTSARVYCIRKE